MNTKRIREIWLLPSSSHRNTTSTEGVCSKDYIFISKSLIEVYFVFRGKVCKGERPERRKITRQKMWQGIWRVFGLYWIFRWASVTCLNRKLVELVNFNIFHLVDWEFCEIRYLGIRFRTCRMTCEINIINYLGNHGYQLNLLILIFSIQ